MKERREGGREGQDRGWEGGRKRRVEGKKGRRKGQGRRGEREGPDENLDHVGTKLVPYTF